MLNYKGMKLLSKDTKFAHLGKPGTIFSRGFARRLKKVNNVISLENKKILDLGAGEGVWMFKFREFTKPQNIYGLDYDKNSFDKFISSNKKFNPKIPDGNFKIGPAEKLEFQNEFFDIVFQNEVLEHVNDDVLTISECFRVLKKHGYLVVFTPNRLWPFEQHGMFLGKKYVWGNIPILPWLPKFVQKQFAPHVRNYSCTDINKILESAAKKADIKYKVIHHKHVFPGFDGIESRFGKFGGFIRKFFHALESTPLEKFGISHFLVIEKL
jgi:ubiquinone/menaquinone biosynthesis C-methylase UbiE